MPIFSEPQNCPDSPANSSAAPPPEPLQVVAEGGAKRVLDPMEMQIVPAGQNAANFELPEGWVVEVRPRGIKSSVSSDKYYYEPGTGRKFRSLISIKRYLTGEEEILPRKRQNNCLVPYQNAGSFKRVVYGGKVLGPDELEEAHNRNLDDIVPTSLQPRSSFLLPDGWIVEEVPRRCGSRSDRYYIEPTTGQKFRSVPEVQRYLARENYKSRCTALALSNHATAKRGPPPRRRHTSSKLLKDIIYDLKNPPEKINWKFSGDGRDNWSPLLEECVLPDYAREQWQETFLQEMTAFKQRVPVPQLTMGGNNQV